METAAEKPDIFAYLDFRCYLKDMLRYMRAQDPEFTFKKLADLFNLGSRSHFIDIVKGRKLTPRYLPQYVRIFGFSAREAEYFRALVAYNQAGNAESKKRNFQLLSAISPNLKTVRLEKEVYDYFEQWYVPAILSLLDVDRKLHDHHAIARRLRPSISAVQARHGLKRLQELGFISWDGAERAWKLHHKFFQCTDEARAVALRAFHRQMLDLGTRVFIEDEEKQKLSTLTLSVSEPTRTGILDLIAELRGKVLEIVKKDRNPNMVLQVNFHTFLLSDEAPRQTEEGSHER